MPFEQYERARSRRQSSKNLVERQTISQTALIPCLEIADDPLCGYPSRIGITEVQKVVDSAKESILGMSSVSGFGVFSTGARMGRTPRGINARKNDRPDHAPYGFRPHTSSNGFSSSLHSRIPTGKLGSLSTIIAL